MLPRRHSAPNRRGVARIRVVRVQIPPGAFFNSRTRTRSHPRNRNRRSSLGNPHSSLRRTNPGYRTTRAGTSRRLPSDGRLPSLDASPLSSAAPALRLTRGTKALGNNFFIFLL